MVRLCMGYALSLDSQCSNVFAATYLKSTYKGRPCYSCNTDVHEVFCRSLVNQVAIQVSDTVCAAGFLAGKRADLWNSGPATSAPHGWHQVGYTHGARILEEAKLRSLGGSLKTSRNRARHLRALCREIPLAEEEKRAHPSHCTHIQTHFASIHCSHFTFTRYICVHPRRLQILTRQR